jgi:hypothetical protein
MDKTTLTIVRGKLTALETGLAVGVYEPEEVRDEAAAIEQLYSEMPDAERARLDILKMAGIGDKGLPC